MCMPPMHGALSVPPHMPEVNQQTAMQQPAPSPTMATKQPQTHAPVPRQADVESTQRLQELVTAEVKPQPPAPPQAPIPVVPPAPVPAAKQTSSQSPSPVPGLQ